MKVRNCVENECVSEIVHSSSLKQLLVVERAADGSDEMPSRLHIVE